MPLLDYATLARVDVDFMDADHEREVQLLNAAAGAVGQLRAGGRDRARVQAALDALLDHTRAHFAREEGAMARAGYPRTRLHQAEHRLVLDAMENVAGEFAGGGDAESLWEYVSTTIPDWLVLHVSTVDADAAAFLRAAPAR